MSWSSGEKEDHYDGPQEKIEYKDALLFGIELTPYSLQRNSKGTLNLQEILQGIYDSITDRLITSLYDYSGVYIYNTSPKNGDPDDTIDAVIPLGIPSARELKNLKYLIEHEDALLERFIPNDKPIVISNTFFSAQEAFLEKAPGTFSRRFFWITSNDNPAPTPREKTVAVTKANEKSPFDVSIFYEAIRYRSVGVEDDANIEQRPKPISALFVKRQIHARHVIKRPLFNVTVELGNLKFGVRGYKNISKQTVLKKHEVYSKGEEQKIVHHHSKILSDKSQKEIKYKELSRYYEVGEDAKIPFTKEEIAKIKYFEDPIIRIIGFDNVLNFPEWQNYTTSTFLYPSETVWKGSASVFVSLYNSMTKLNRVAIAWAILTRGSTPSIVMLIPSPEKLDDAGTQVIPLGLNLVHLPFREYIRELPPSRVENGPGYYDQPDQELVDKTKEIISALHMKGYDASRYPNPKLQWFYKILQAHALEEEFNETVPEDKTQPKYKSINTLAGDKIAEWNELAKNNHFS